MQCTSSITKRDTLLLRVSLAKICLTSGFWNCSGDKNKNFNEPTSSLWKIFFCSLAVSADTNAARWLKPNCCNSKTWSRIRAVIGQTTIVQPNSIAPKVWKQRDLPPPVGKSPNTEWLSIAEEIISNWPLRNSSKPKMIELSCSKFCFKPRFCLITFPSRFVCVRQIFGSFVGSLLSQQYTKFNWELRTLIVLSVRGVSSRLRNIDKSIFIVELDSENSSTRIHLIFGNFGELGKWNFNKSYVLFRSLSAKSGQSSNGWKSAFSSRQAPFLICFCSNNVTSNRWSLAKPKRS